MASLDQYTHFPPDLPWEIAPSVPDLIARIERWIIYHLKQTIQSDVHFENQLYGSINALLASIFPLERRFMIIPQACLRRAMEAEEVTEDLGNISIGSTGALHESRNLSGHEAEIYVPDFVIVKVIPRPAPGPREHHIVCIVEVKRNSHLYSDATHQMFSYMAHAAEHPLREDNLRSFLVMANLVIPFWLERKSQGYGWQARQGARFDMFAPGDQFTRELCEIAIRNWNNPS